MNKFKIGDKVKILDGRNKPIFRSTWAPTWVGGMDKYIGEVCTVRYIDEIGDYSLKGINYSFAEEWLAPVEFTKADLKEFDIVEFKNGNKTLVINDIILGELSIGGFDLISWTDDLRDKYTDKYDIMKIYRSTDSIPTDRSKWNDLPVVYERTEVKEMTIEEISEALGYEVKVVK